MSEAIERKKKIAEIREALEKATPGPWEYEMWQGMADVYPTSGKRVPICQLWTKTEEPMENGDNNAHLIANAPEWLRFLLSELEREREENRKLMEELDKELELGFSLECQLQSAQQEIERLRKIVNDSEALEDDWIKLKSERDKMIEGLRDATYLLGKVPMNDARLWGVYNKLCDILHEIGVTTE